eukprot:7491862-Ditylum_brightwellii.AAC.1
MTAKVLPITTISGDITNMNNITKENDDKTKCFCHENKCLEQSNLQHTNSFSPLCDRMHRICHTITSMHHHAKKNKNKENTVLDI